MKSLIVFFSRSGENYIQGTIQNLKVGNTQKVAEKIQSLTGGDMFAITPAFPYASDYKTCVLEAKNELEKKARPIILSSITNMDRYDIIYLGFPNWWGTCPMPVFTFLDEHTIQKQIVIPFCTHEGSGFSNSINDLKQNYNDITFAEGLAVVGSEVDHMDQKIENWLSSFTFT